jgi:glyoxylase-like metal-dependent hydrolase (beta-lactamase superfamily II)
LEKPSRVYGNVYLIGSTEISHPYDCLVYLIDLDELILVDTGAGLSYQRLLENVVYLGFKPERITTILVTHAHIDHIGALNQFKEHLGCKIIAHNKDSKAIESGSGTGADVYGIDYIPCPVDIKLLKSEEQIKIGSQQFNIVHIPGHTPGSIAIYLDLEGKRILFGQDIHGPYLRKWGADPIQAKSSLKKLMELKADILCEGHFGIFQPAAEVEQYIKEYFDAL